MLILKNSKLDKISSSSSLMDKEIFHSLVSQTSSLFSKIEYHILGNHILSNAKALILLDYFLKAKMQICG